MGLQDKHTARVKTEKGTKLLNVPRGILRLDHHYITRCVSVGIDR